MGELAQPLEHGFNAAAKEYYCENKNLFINYIDDETHEFKKSVLLVWRICPIMLITQFEIS